MRSFLIIHSLIAIILTNYCHSQIFAPDQKKIISELARNRKVIAVGEETHFKKSLVDARIKIIKELVTEHQIDIIAIEGSINVSHIINEYVSGQTQSIIFHEVLPGLNEPYLLQGAGLYDCEQMIEFIEWLREFNSKRKNKITFAGFDFQNFSVPIDSLQKYSNGDIEINYKLSSIQTTLRKSILSILDSGINVIATRNWLETFRSARKDLKYVERQIFSDENAIFFDELKQFTNLWDAPSFPRDSLMFENLKKNQP
ncbi:erythromycin esterase family protein [Sphingobacterium populi]|uniref:erythromycin esterase family protein n=1 Tax=Sphingobacterium sp. CFCC 11742 TaxID=1775560 RepID=UPI000833FD84|nr:erythromycin esterase family protein [Sphingobacterium sp. CFCC 11742]